LFFNLIAGWHDLPSLYGKQLQTFKNNSMKKLVLLLAIVFATQLAFASDATAASSASNSFNRDFHKATNVQWQYTESYARASFLLDNRLMSAYYTSDGELMAVTRNIVCEQLPLKLLMELKQNYSSYWISNLFEVVNGSGDQYYITLENGDETLVLKAKAHKRWKLYQKTVKI
jgi:hypothetical protein